MGAAALGEEGDPLSLTCCAGFRRHLSPRPTPPLTSCPCPKSRLHWCQREVGKGRVALEMGRTSPQVTTEPRLLLGWAFQPMLWTSMLNSHQSLVPSCNPSPGAGPLLLPPGLCTSTQASQKVKPRCPSPGRHHHLRSLIRAPCGLLGWVGV